MDRLEKFINELDTHFASLAQKCGFGGCIMISEPEDEGVEGPLNYGLDILVKVRYFLDLLSLHY